MKKIVAILVYVGFISSAFAQYSPSWKAGDTLVFAFNKDWDAIDNINAATFYRKAYPVGDDRYKVFDYYTNGKLQMVAVQDQADPVYDYTDEFGEQVYYSESGDTTSFYLYDDLGNPKGRHFSRHDDGSLAFEAIYSNNGKKATKRWFYENGNLETEYTSIDGKKDGLYKTYYENGQLERTGLFAKGDEEGEWTYYHENGELEGKVEYKKGDRVGTTSFYANNGQLVSKGKYKDGSKAGVWEYTHDNGEPYYVVKYQNGRYHGDLKKFDEDGNLTYQGRYEEGKPVGTHTYYYASGSKMEEEVFDVGYPMLSNTKFFENSEVKMKQEGDEITYFDESGTELTKAEVRTNPLPVDNIFSSLFKQYAKLPSEKAVKAGRGVYTFSISKTGEVDSAWVEESITDVSDALLLEAIEQLSFEPGVHFKENKSFLQSISVLVEDSTLYQVSEGVYSPSAAEATDTYTIVEEMPHYPGGEDELFRYLGQNTRYPALARDEGAQGVVYVNFIVNECGIIQNTRILRGVHPTLDIESKRVVEAMPTWTPGRQRGKNVNVSYNLPIRFILK